MSLKVTDNFDFGSKKPFVKRNEFSSIKEMKDYSEAFINEGCRAMVNVGTATNPKWKEFKWLSANSNDLTYGRWREASDGAKIISGNVSNVGVLTLTDSSITELKDGLYLLKFASDVGSSMNSITFNSTSYYLNYRGSHTAGLLHNIIQSGDSVLFFLASTDFCFISVDAGNGRQLLVATDIILGGIKTGKPSVGGVDWSGWDADVNYAITTIVSGPYQGFAYMTVPKADNNNWGTVKITPSNKWETDTADDNKKDLYVPTLLAVENAISSATVGVATSSNLGGIKIGYPNSELCRAVNIATEQNNNKDKAYVTLEYASDSDAGIIKTSSSSISNDSDNSQVKYPLKSSTNHNGYVPVPYASSNNRGVVQLSDYSNINTDIANSIDTKAVTPRAVNSVIASVATSAATTAVNNKMWFGTKSEYEDLATKDPNVLYFVTY